MKAPLFLFCFLCLGEVAAAGNELTPDILLEWKEPAARVDGSLLVPEEIEGYRLYHVVNEAEETVINLTRVTSYTAADVVPGVHSFQISTVANGEEGPRSDSISIPVLAPAVPAKITSLIIVSCDNAGECSKRVVY